MEAKNTVLIFCVKQIIKFNSKNNHLNFRIEFKSSMLLTTTTRALQSLFNDISAISTSANHYVQNENYENKFIYENFLHNNSDLFNSSNQNVTQLEGPVFIFRNSCARSDRAIDRIW